MRILATFLLLLALFIVFQCGYVHAARFKFTNFVCDSVNESLILVHKCRLKAVRRDRTTLNFNGTLQQTVNNARVHGQIFKKASGYKPWLYNITLNGCRFMRKPYEPVAILVYNLFKQYSNMNKPCPYHGPVYVMGFHLLGSEIPVPLPSGDYLVLIKWYTDNILIISTGIYFSFEENWQ